MIGQRVGPYLVEALLGMGGMGAVYKARDTRLGRGVALKIVRPDREDTSGVSPEARLLAEARAAATLRHPHIVAVYDAGVADGQTYVAMELIQGRPLRAWVGDIGVPLATRKRWLIEVASALSAAHHAGFVHRDVKPENVLIDDEGAARVLDFGLVKRMAYDETAPTADEPLQQSTLEGRVVGTVSYMAPEQLAGGEPDARWDQFAWGVMAFEVLTGSHPRLTVAMPGPTAHLTQAPKLPSALVPELTASDDEAVMKAMDTNASRRHPSMEAAITALRQSGAPAPTLVPALVPTPAPSSSAAPSAPPSRSWGFVAVLVALATGGGVLLGRAMARREQAPTPGAGPSPLLQAAVASAAPTPPAPPEVVIASAVATTSVAATPSASTSKAPLPADYGTHCMCASPGGHLCPKTANAHMQSCSCTLDNDGMLSGPTGYTYIGRDFSNGEVCRGVDGDGHPRNGKLADCEINCDENVFAGLHRTACRGVSRRTGATEDGLLFCYSEGRIMR